MTNAEAEKHGNDLIAAAGIAVCDLGDACEGCVEASCSLCEEQAEFEVSDMVRREGL